MKSGRDPDETIRLDKERSVTDGGRYDLAFPLEVEPNPTERSCSGTTKSVSIEEIRGNLGHARHRILPKCD